MNFYDFNTAQEQSSFDLIPQGTIAKVRMTIKPGGHNDEDKGWTGGYATHSAQTSAVFLACEFVILEGDYAKRKVWSNIGLYSDKNNNRWGEMGRSFIRAMLNSAHGLSSKDQSEAAQAKRHICGIADLDGLEFVAKIDVGTNAQGNPKNEINYAITADHDTYSKVMGKQLSVEDSQTQAATMVGRPSWV